jgi:hypothetical protein
MLNCWSSLCSISLGSWPVVLLWCNLLIIIWYNLLTQSCCHLHRSGWRRNSWLGNRSSVHLALQIFALSKQKPTNTKVSKPQQICKNLKFTTTQEFGNVKSKKLIFTIPGPSAFLLSIQTLLALLQCDALISCTCR